MLSILETAQGYIKTVVNYLEPAMILPALTIYGLVLFYIYYIRITRPLAGTTEWIDREVNKPRMTFLVKRHPMERRDIFSDGSLQRGTGIMQVGQTHWLLRLAGSSMKRILRVGHGADLWLSKKYINALMARLERRRPTVS